MIAIPTMGWLSDITTRVGDNLKRSISPESKPDPTRLGILAFETAKTMSRLISLYKSLSDSEISKLKNHIIKSQGIFYLNSKDEGLLLSLACAERIEDLDKAATTVVRLGRKCSDFGLNRFDLVYTDLKMGVIDLRKLEYGSMETEKKVSKIERLISCTSCLYTSLEALAELEIAERKLKRWKKNSVALQVRKMNINLFDQKISNQRKQVCNFREISLWNQTFDKSVGLMARIICVVYARICIVFGTYIPVLPSVSLCKSIRIIPEFYLIDPIREQICSQSGPIPTIGKPNLVRFYSRKSILFLSEDVGCGEGEMGKNNRVFHAAGSWTVGGSGLALRYASVILLAERYLDSGTKMGNDARDNLYEMLPENLKISVWSKLSKNVRCREEDELLAEGWREAVTAIMGWLAPMARDTMTWQQERNLEKKKFDSKPTVLLLQTLHFSDKEKTDVAIVEVLVGLSCIYKYDNR